MPERLPLESFILDPRERMRCPRCWRYFGGQAHRHTLGIALCAVDDICPRCLLPYSSRMLLDGRVQVWVARHWPQGIGWDRMLRGPP